MLRSAAEAAQDSVLRITISGPGARRAIKLGLNKALVVDLPADAHDILVADPVMADAVTRSSRRIYLFGKMVGQTNIFIFGADGNEIVSLDIDQASPLPVTVVAEDEATLQGADARPTTATEAATATEATAGCSLMTRSCQAMMRFTSVREVAGSSTGMKRSEPSLSVGMKSLPRRMAGQADLLVQRGDLLTGEGDRVGSGCLASIPVGGVGDGIGKAPARFPANRPDGCPAPRAPRCGRPPPRCRVSASC